MMVLAETEKERAIAYATAPDGVSPVLAELGSAPSCADVLKSSVAVKRRSVSFWEGNRLEDVLELSRGLDFAPGEKLTRADIAQDARQCAGCGHFLKVHFPTVNESTGEIPRPYIFKGSYCQMPAVCPVCSRRVGDVRQKRYADPIEHHVGEGLLPYLVTFTVDAEGDLRSQLARLRRALRVFHTRWRLSKRRPTGYTGEWQKVVSAALKIEVKRGNGSGLWHVHAHALVFTFEPLDFRVYASRADKRAGRPMRLVEFRGVPVPASKITAEWLEATGGAAMGVHVRPLDRDSKTGRRMSPKDVVMASREILKYCSILDDRSTSGDWLTIRRGLWGRRLWSVYGGFRGIPGAEDDYTDEDPDTEYAQEVRVFWRGRSQTGNYERIGSPRLIDARAHKDFSLKLLTLRARVSGIARRLRSAAMRARESFESTGNLPTALAVEVVSVKGQPVVQEWAVPAYLTEATARDDYAWERWVDEISEASRYILASAKADVADVGIDDVIAYRAGDASPWDEMLRGFAFVDHARRRAAAFAALEGGGLQQNAFAPDYFDPASVDAFLVRNNPDRVPGDRSGWPEGYFEPSRFDRFPSAPRPGTRRAVRVAAIEVAARSRDEVLRDAAADMAAFLTSSSSDPP